MVLVSSNRPIFFRLKNKHEISLFSRSIRYKVSFSTRLNDFFLSLMLNIVVKHLLFVLNAILKKEKKKKKERKKEKKEEKEEKRRKKRDIKYCGKKIIKEW